MTMRHVSLFFLIVLIGLTSYAQVDSTDWMYEYPEGCTTITVGKQASADGSVITSHTDDSHRTRSWVDIIPAKDHAADAKTKMYKRVQDNEKAMTLYAHKEIGEIPQISHTYGFINTAYPCMNEKQLAIGESTFGGRKVLQSDNGLIDCQRLVQLMLERCTTARDAIKMADELTKEYGWNDAGECLTIADTKEVWHFEIVGSGKGNKGAIWVAQRVPDDHVAVNANASRIGEINLKDKDYFMASKNIYEMAKDSGWWKKSEETFRFYEAYAPEGRNSIAARRREWRVFDLLAPSLKLHPDDKNYPFSVKPDKKVTLQMLVDVFKDYYEATPYDMTRNIKATDKDGKTIVSPLANPFMPYEQLEIQNINGEWYHWDREHNHIAFLGERTIARWYTMYATITQSRDWLPDDVGGVVWLAQDNVATSIYIPVYCSVTDLPKSYKTPGRVNGYTRESAWWAFNRLGTLTAQRWGDMRHDVDSVWIPMQTKMFRKQMQIEKQALEITGEKKRREFLTKYTLEKGDMVVKRAWKLGDYLWTKYDEKF